MAERGELWLVAAAVVFAIVTYRDLQAPGRAAGDAAADAAGAARPRSPARHGRGPTVSFQYCIS